MNKIKVLYLVIICLVGINATLLFLHLNKPIPPRPEHIIIERLGFDNQQKEEYQQLIYLHTEEIKTKQHAFAKLKDGLFAELKESNSIKKDSIIQEIGKLQQRIEALHFSHFLKIKAICKDDQIQKFNTLTRDLGRIFAHRKPPKKKH